MNRLRALSHEINWAGPKVQDFCTGVQDIKRDAIKRFGSLSLPE